MFRWPPYLPTTPPELRTYRPKKELPPEVVDDLGRLWVQKSSWAKTAALLIDQGKMAGPPNTAEHYFRSALFRRLKEDGVITPPEKVEGVYFVFSKLASLEPRVIVQRLRELGIRSSDLNEMGEWAKQEYAPMFIRLSSQDRRGEGISQASSAHEILNKVPEYVERLELEEAGEGMRRRRIPN